MIYEMFANICFGFQCVSSFMVFDFFRLTWHVDIVVCGRVILLGGLSSLFFIF
jgi:hypothetical protein